MKRLVLATLASILALSSAFADDGYRRWDRPGTEWDGGRHGHGRHFHDDSSGDAVVGGVAGLVTGLVIGGMLSDQPRVEYRVREPRVYVEPYPYSGHVRRPYRSEILRPWSPAWYRWCMSAYRSFDPDTGTYVGYDGLRRFCIAR